jgi:hypothetical protein
MLPILHLISILHLHKLILADKVYFQETNETNFKLLSVKNFANEELTEERSQRKKHEI